MALAVLIYKHKKLHTCLWLGFHLTIFLPFGGHYLTVPVSHHLLLFLQKNSMKNLNLHLYSMISGSGLMVRQIVKVPQLPHTV